MFERFKGTILMNLRVTIIFSAMLLTLFILLSSCFNPFAPIEGDVGARTWREQVTIGGLLENFSLAYDYRDSLRYANCLADNFTFQYFDIENGRSDHWYRETDLRATGGLFRNYSHIDLEWNQVPVWVESFDQPDTTVQFVVRFNLTLDDELPIMGYAHFSTSKARDDVFRLTSWRDDF